MVTSNQQPEPAFDGWEDADDAPRADEALIVNIEGFEGPLDLLLFGRIESGPFFALLERKG